MGDVDAPSLKKLKAVVYEVDDVVDEFQLKAENYEAGGDGGFAKHLCTKPKSFVFQCRAAKKIKKIKKTFDDIVKQITVLNSVVGRDPASYIYYTAVNRQTLPFVDGAAVIGRDQEMHQTISKLLETDDRQRINIVSIVGLGGSGKTTLAQLVFNDIQTIRNHFTLRLWVHVSQEFHVEKMIKKLFDAIPDEKSEGLSLMSMANKISDKLTELPCLEKLVLKEMTALKSISGGPFPLLSELSMGRMPRLGVVWMITQRSLADVEGGQLQIGNRLSVLSISYCPEVTVMPYFPSSLKVLRLVKSNVQLLGQPGLGQGSSLPSFSFSCLKKLELKEMPPPAGAGAWYGSGCRWEQLQHLTVLESLVIRSCDGLTELQESMRCLASLRTLWIWYCSAPCMLPEWLGKLHCLENMGFYKCGSLILAPSMQPLRALKALHIGVSGWVEDLCSPSLQTMSIQDCDSISSLPQSFRQLTSLTNLEITRCRDFHQLPECLGELRSLQKLYINGLHNLSSLPQSLGYLTSLQELQIEYCEALGQLPDCVGELRSLRVFKILSLRSLTCLPQSLGRLTSLQELEIESCKALGQLPESLGELRSLRKFGISSLLGLTSVPKSICYLTSLEQLTIGHCPGIRSLAEWIEGLTALQTLEIWGCPDLERRCERRKGKDWHLISHIPYLRIV